MKLNERIYLLRTKCNLTQKELGKMINVSVVSIGGWENGTRKPSAEAIISLATAFGVTTDYLLGVAIEPERDSLLLNQREKALLYNYRDLDKFGKKAVDTLCAIEKSRMSLDNTSHNNIANIALTKTNSERYIPKYTTPSAAGISVPLDGDDFEMILVDNTVPVDADFAVCIQGNSMYPYIHDGDTVYVKKDTELSVGDVGIFSVDGAMYCKQYYLDSNNNLMLLSANPQFEHTNIYINAESSTNVKCYGRVLLGFKIDLPEYFANVD